MLTRRQLIASAGAALAVPRVAAAQTRGPAWTIHTLDDASRLNGTVVARHAILQPDSDRALIESLRGLLKEAADGGRPVCVGGARHSMGGQSLMGDSFAASLYGPRVEADTAARRYRVLAGT